MSGYGTSVPGVPDGSNGQAGWYPDPSGAAAQRWWDGTSWSASTQPYPLQAPMTAYPVPTVKNTPATAGLVLGIVAMFVDPLTIPALLGIIFSGIGLNRASTLSRHGYAPVGRAKAVWGLVLSILGMLGTIFFKVMLF